LQAAVERETELEQRMAESNSALMRMQKIVDERNQRVTDMEHKLAMLEVRLLILLGQFLGLKNLHRT
jgi:uncharacterized coiled-coil protein SlyX